MKKQVNAEMDRLVDENKQLKIENESMKKILGSRRFRMAEKIANIYNAIFPDGTVRRKSLRVAYAPIRWFVRWRARRNVVKLERSLRDFQRIIVIHSIPWNTPLKQRPHHLAKCLAEQDNKTVVVYFEPDEQIKDFRRVSKNLVTVNSWSTVMNMRKSRDKKYYFFFNNVSNIPFNVVKDVKNSGFEIVYEYIDEFHEDISGSLINQLEVWDGLPELKPCLVLASAQKLFNEARKHFRNSKVLLSKNAVVVEDFDFNNFLGKESPSDLKGILAQKKPVVGYYGALAPWLDYDLISNTARQCQDFNFVLIGVNYQNALQKLDLTLDNVFYLGPKKYEELPKYSCFFDCAIIPFKNGQIAKGTSPVKLFEYMAMGLPTVGTKDLDECKGYEYVYLANSKEEFIRMVKDAIRERANKKVRKCLLFQAESNSWDGRAKDILAELA